ncbi:hypothetical protein ACIF70_20085 [Actinacidiphila glaucinigra]|uniref:hypothetical protein n=1 Tax=Actinacidiphila glaucinigra TaxID=235986 RepID=UPI0037C790E2
MAADDGIAWIGGRWPDSDDPLVGVQAGLVFAEDVAPQDLAVVFGAVPWEIPEPVGAEAKDGVGARTAPSINARSIKGLCQSDAPGPSIAVAMGPPSP